MDFSIPLPNVDCQIISKDGKTYHYSKLVLQRISPYFAAQYSGTYRNEPLVFNFEGDIINLVLNYIDSFISPGHIKTDIIDSSNVFSLLEISKYILLDDLYNDCLDAITKNVDLVSRDYGLQDYIEYTKEYFHPCRNKKYYDALMIAHSKFPPEKYGDMEGLMKISFEDIPFTTGGSTARYLSFVNLWLKDEDNKKNHLDNVLEFLANIATFTKEQWIIIEQILELKYNTTPVFRLFLKLRLSSRS
jgi:hypothetical protein